MINWFTNANLITTSYSTASIIAKSNVHNFSTASTLRMIDTHFNFRIEHIQVSTTSASQQEVGRLVSGDSEASHNS